MYVYVVIDGAVGLYFPEAREEGTEFQMYLQRLRAGVAANAAAGGGGAGGVGSPAAAASSAHLDSVKSAAGVPTARDVRAARTAALRAKDARGGVPDVEVGAEPAWGAVPWGGLGVRR